MLPTKDLRVRSGAAIWPWGLSPNFSNWGVPMSYILLLGKLLTILFGSGEPRNQLSSGNTIRAGRFVVQANCVRLLNIALETKAIRQQILLSFSIVLVPAWDFPIPCGRQQEQRQASISPNRPVKYQHANASAQSAGFLESPAHSRAHGTDLSLAKTPGGAIFAPKYLESGKCWL